MDASHRKKKSASGKSNKDDFSMARTASAAAPSSCVPETHREDFLKEDGVQLRTRSHQSSQQQPTLQKQPDYPKKPLTSYNFFVKDKFDQIVRNNPGMNSMEIASLCEKMFKALGKKKKQNYFQLARVAREKYQKQVQEFKEAYPDHISVRTSEKIEGPQAPTPFLLFCMKYYKSRKSTSWCEQNFTSLSDQARLKWIDLALAKEANYLEEFEKFKTDNPHLKPKMTPVLNDEENLLVYMRCLFPSEYPRIPSKKDGTPTKMTQWGASWNALSKEEKNKYQEKVVAMKKEFNRKLYAYLSTLPFVKRGQETTNSLPDAKGVKRKKEAETDESSASSKKSKLGIGNPSPQLDTNGSDPSSTSSSDNESLEMSCASSSSSQSGIQLTPSVNKCSAIQNEEESSEEDESDSSEGDESSEKSSSKVSSSKPMNGINRPTSSLPKTSTAADSSDESDSDEGKKLSTFLPKLPIEKRQQQTAKRPTEANRIKRKQRAETDESSASSAKKSKPAFSDHSGSDSFEEEEPLTLPIIRSKKKVAKVKESGNKSASVTSNSNDESENSDDVTLLPKKKLISPPKSAESSEESSEESDSELAQPNLSKKKVSMVASTESNYLTLAKKAECGIGNPSPQPGTNGSYPSSSTASDDESQKLKRSSSSSSKSGKSITPVRIAIQSEDDSSDEDEADSSDEEESNGPNDLSSSMANGFKAKIGLPKTSDAVDTSDEVDSDDIGSENPSNKKQDSPKSDEESSDESSSSSSDNESQEMNHSSSSSSKISKIIAPSKTVVSAIQSEEETSDEEDSDSSDGEEKSNGPNTKSSGEEMDKSSASSKQSKSLNIQKYPSEKELSTLPIVENSSVDGNSGDVTLPKTKPISPVSAEKSSEASSKEIGSEEELSIINTNSSTIGKDSTSSVRPLWALRQKLFKNEPPKPPKTAAEWHAFEICQDPNIPDEKMKKLWNELSEKKRKMLEIEHTKRLQEYEEKLQAFKNGLSKTELQAYINIKRSQCVESDDESD